MHSKRILALLVAASGAALALLGGTPDAAGATGSPSTVHATPPVTGPPAAVHATPPATGESTAGGSTFTNHALDSRLALRGDNPVVTPPGTDPTEAWSVVYVPEIPNLPGFSSPYLLRSAVTGKCLRDEGPNRLPFAITCQPGPTPESRTLWHHHRLPDLVDNDRNFYYRFSRFSGNVLTAAASLGDGRTAPVVCVPIAASRAEASAQLWREQPA